MRLQKRKVLPHLNCSFAQVFKKNKTNVSQQLHKEEKELEPSCPGQGDRWISPELKCTGSDLTYRLGAAQCLQLVRIKHKAKH